MAKRKKRNVPAKKSSKKGKKLALLLAAFLSVGVVAGAAYTAYRYLQEPPAQEQPGEETPGEGEEPGGTETPDPETPGGGGEGTETPGGENPDGPENPGTGEEPGGETPDPETPVEPDEPDVPDEPEVPEDPAEPDVPAIEYDTEYALWNLPASDGYSLQDGKMTLLGTQELVFTTKAMYNSVTLSFTIDSVADIRGSFQIGWGAQSPNASINDLPYVQFNYDRAVLCLPDGTTYDTSWVTGDAWRLTIDVENNKVVLMVGETVVYNVDTAWWAQESWSLPGYIILRAESNCARTIDKMHIQA